MADMMQKLVNFQLGMITNGNDAALKIVREYATAVGGAEGALGSLNAADVDGDRIVELYADVCNKDMRVFTIVLEAVNLKIVTKEELHRAIAEKGTGLDIQAINAQVLKKTLANLDANKRTEM